MLQRQEHLGHDVKSFTVKAPRVLVDELVKYAFDWRMTQAAVVTLLLKKALDAESGMPYLPEKRKEAKR